MCVIVKDVDFKEVKKEKKFEKMKRAASKKKEKFCNWCGNHKEVLIPLAPVVIGGAIDLTKIYLRSRATKGEQTWKDTHVYDPSCRHFHELTRKPSSKEWREVDNRTKSGELLANVLKEMDLTK